jgi:Tol biopolymer transport system component
MMKRAVWASLLLATLVSAACTSTEKQVPSPSGDEATSNDGASIVFNRGTGDDLAVFAINADGSGEQRIRTVNDGAILSPDGTRFMDPVIDDAGKMTTSVFHLDGTAYELLPIDDPTLELGYGAWSPNGESFVTDGWDATLTPDVRKGLYTRSSSNGGNIVRLTDAGVRNDFPMTPGGYSPDGSRILFFRPATRADGDGEPMNLFVVNADGTGLQKLNAQGTTTGLVGGGIAASWSPDGQSVAVVLSWTSFWNDDARAVYVMDADGSHPEPITPQGDILSAQWSPDARWIAFDMSTPDGPHNLFVVHPDGTGLDQITSSEQDGRFSYGPVWSPDSTRLLFVRGLGDFEDTNLWSANVDGTQLEQITDSSGGYGGYAWVPSAD